MLITPCLSGPHGPFCLVSLRLTALSILFPDRIQVVVSKTHKTPPNRREMLLVELKDIRGMGRT